MNGISDDAPFRRPRRQSNERRQVGGRRKEDELPRATVTRKVIAVIVALINLVYLVIDQLADQCNWLVF